MRIEFLLPRPSEAKVTIDEKKGVLVVEPVFPTAQALRPIFYGTCYGKTGRERKFVIQIAAKDGRIVAHGIREAVAEFDSTGPDDYDEPVRDQEDEEDIEDVDA